VLTVKGLVCTECGIKQYFGVDQPYGMLNRHWSINKAFRLAIRHLWFSTKHLGEGLCPTCVEKHKPRIMPKVKVHKFEVERDPYGYGHHMPFMLLFWRKKIEVHGISIHENSLRFDTGRYNYILFRDQLIDPLMFDLFTTKHKKPDYHMWFEGMLRDQMDYVHHLSKQPMDRGETLQVLREPVENGGE
jgi:hypothetical protein